MKDELEQWQRVIDADGENSEVWFLSTIIGMMGGLFAKSETLPWVVPLAGRIGEEKVLRIELSLSMQQLGLGDRLPKRFTSAEIRQWMGAAEIPEEFSNSGDWRVVYYYTDQVSSVASLDGAMLTELTEPEMLHRMLREMEEEGDVGPGPISSGEEPGPFPSQPRF